MEKIRVMFADDHPFFRTGLRAFLASVDDIEITGEASSGEESVTLALQDQPDVILMDLNMPDVNGIEATRRIMETSPHIGIIILTMFDDDESIFSAMRAGARGYLLKGAGQEETLRAIRAVGSGEAIFSPSVARRLMHYFSGLQPAVAVPLPELTEREREILTMIAQGLGNAELAARLHLSPKTVRNHITNIFSKLQVADRTQAIMRAKEAGLGG
ncbi:MAG: response regulator [Clostridia bacterium]